MKTKTLFLLTNLALCASLLQSGAQGTAFTYQGRLTDEDNPASGSYDMAFVLYDAPLGGTQSGPILTNRNMSVSAGLFSTSLDFGGGVFTGAGRWLEIYVRTNGPGSFAVLSPRQKLQPAPYAIYSASAATAATAMTANTANTANTAAGVAVNGIGTVALQNGAVTSPKIADGTISVADLNATVVSNTFWRLNGNAGTFAGAPFLGTTDNQPLEFRVNGLRALRIEDNGDPNLIGGSSINFVAPGVGGATISGGGTTNFLGVGFSNSVFASFGVVAGGLGNRIARDSSFATIGGGFFNDIGTNSDHASIGGGYDNSIAGHSAGAAIAAGNLNDIGTNASHSLIGGGYNNDIAANSEYATIAGGNLNDIGDASSYSVIGGGNENEIADDSMYTTIGGGSLNAIADNATYATIAGGYSNEIHARDSVIGGGYANSIGAESGDSTIAGGIANQIADHSDDATIGGGFDHDIGTNSSWSTIGGGFNHTIDNNSEYATIPGGRFNRAGMYAFAAGYNAVATNQSAFVWSGSSGTPTYSTTDNSVTFRASGGYRFFTGTGSGGAQLAAGATAWSVLSDRNVKKDIRPVDYESILDKLSRVPISQWHYAWETDSAPLNLGPMAQDFKAAFFPGRDETSISTLEFDGVALAAIQGLNKLVKQKETEILSLKDRLEQLERLVRNLAEQNSGGAR